MTAPPARDDVRTSRRRTGRLAWALAVAGTGGIVLALGTRLAWVTAIAPGRRTDAGALGDVLVGERALRWRGTDLAPEVVALGIVVPVVALLGFLVGPRLRGALAGVALAAAVAAIVAAIAAAADPQSAIANGPGAATQADSASAAHAAGWWVTLAGGAGAAAGAGWTLAEAGRVRRLGLPEVVSEGDR